MAENPAAHGPLPKDSPHVMAFTHVRRGATPGVWEDSTAPGYAGRWELVPQGGPADISTGEADGDYPDGPGGWKQI